MIIMINAAFSLLFVLFIWASLASSFVAPHRVLHHRASPRGDEPCGEKGLPKRHDVDMHRRLQHINLPPQRQISTPRAKGAADQDDSQLPIDKFRSLMGNLYGVAGLAHAADCYLGDSQLLVAAGSPPTQALPMAGQALVALWCVAGPIAFGASKVGGVAADIGLLFYGAVEVAAAAILESQMPNLGSAAADIDPLTNAVVVQGIVLASWLYSKNKEE